MKRHRYLAGFLRLVLCCGGCGSLSTKPSFPAQPGDPGYAAMSLPDEDYAFLSDLFLGISELLVPCGNGG